MATVQHKFLSGTNLHEPKGVAAATADKVYVSDGVGSGSWQHPIAYGNFHFTSGSGVSMTSGGVDTKIVEATATTALEDFTHSGTGRLTYVGAVDRVAHIQAVVSLLPQSASNNLEATMRIYKNGAPLAGAFNTVLEDGPASRVTMTIVASAEISSNDYFEVFIASDGDTEDVFVNIMTIQAFVKA